MFFRPPVPIDYAPNRAPVTVRVFRRSWSENTAVLSCRGGYGLEGLYRGTEGLTPAADSRISWV
jgi:hypothetical protein